SGHATGSDSERPSLAGSGVLVAAGGASQPDSEAGQYSEYMGNEKFTNSTTRTGDKAFATLLLFHQLFSFPLRVAYFLTSYMMVLLETKSYHADQARSNLQKRRLLPPIALTQNFFESFVVQHQLHQHLSACALSSDLLQDLVRSVMLRGIAFVVDCPVVTLRS